MFFPFNDENKNNIIHILLIYLENSLISYINYLKFMEKIMNENFI